MINFSAWSIHRPLPAILAFTMLMAAGLFAFKKLPIADFPDLEVPFVTVAVTYSGATPAKWRFRSRAELKMPWPVSRACSTSAPM